MRWEDDKPCWQQWFAWFPVYCSDIKKNVWLENVWRAGVLFGPMACIHFYRSEKPDDIFKSPMQKEIA